MRTIITLNLNAQTEKYKYSLHDALNMYKCDYELIINASATESIEHLINNEREIIRNFKKFINEQNYLEIENDIRIINEYLDNKIDIKNSIEYIEINLEEEKDEYDYDYESFSIIKKYIDDNIDFFKDKKIIIKGISKISKEQIKIANEFFSIYENIYYVIEGNSMPISYDEYRNTEKKLDEILNMIKEKNMSPLENLMYLYDLIRNRKYKKADSLAEYNKSSDLTSVLFGEYIVCSGYTELFDYFSQKLGFRTYQYQLKGIECNSHIRNLIYVEDSKYDVDGLYFFDATWDSNKYDNNDFLCYYKFFMKTQEEMEKCDRGRFENNKYFDIDDNIIQQLKKYETLNILNIYDIKQELLIGLNHISKLLQKGDMMQNMALLMNGILPSEDITSLLEEYLEKINKPFNYEKFCKLLYNVRKIQHEENPEFYPFSYDVISDTTINSMIATKEERLLMAIFGEINGDNQYNKKKEKLEQILDGLSFEKQKKKIKK